MSDAVVDAWVWFDTARHRYRVETGSIDQSRNPVAYRLTADSRTWYLVETSDVGVWLTRGPQSRAVLDRSELGVLGDQAEAKVELLGSIHAAKLALPGAQLRAIGKVGSLTAADAMVVDLAPS